MFNIELTGLMTLSKAIVALIRFAFGTASRIAPELTGRAAFRLFCTTFEPRKKSAQHEKRLQSARNLFKRGKAHAISYRGGSIIAFEFMPTEADKRTSTAENKTETIWLVHGWQSQSLLMNHFVEPLLAEGFRVISIDLPGHGESSGRTFHLPLAVSALHAVQSELGEVDMILSHSLGGAVAATAIAGTLPAHSEIAVKKLVLISSPDSMLKIFDDFANMVGLNESARTTLHSRVTELSGKTTDAFNTGLQLASLSNELLVIHAPDDKEVPFSEAESIARQNPRATLLPVPGLGHRRIIAADNVVNACVEFLKV